MTIAVATPTDNATMATITITNVLLGAVLVVALKGHGAHPKSAVEFLKQVPVRHWPGGHVVRHLVHDASDVIVQALLMYFPSGHDDVHEVHTGPEADKQVPLRYCPGRHVEVQLTHDGVKFHEHVPVRY